MEMGKEKRKDKIVEKAMQELKEIARDFARSEEGVRIRNLYNEIRELEKLLEQTPKSSPARKRIEKQIRLKWESLKVAEEKAKKKLDKKIDAWLMSAFEPICKSCPRYEMCSQSPIKRKKAKEDKQVYVG